MFIVSVISNANGLEVKRQWVKASFILAVSTVVWLVQREYDLTRGFDDLKTQIKQDCGWWSSDGLIAVIISQPEES